MLAILRALARRNWAFLLVLSVLAGALWRVWTFRVPTIFSEEERSILLFWRVMVTMPAFLVVPAAVAAKWLEPRQADFKNWLLGPFRRWARSDETRGPKL